MSINAMNQLPIMLRFFVIGSFQICMADQLNITKPTLCRVGKRVTHCIALLRMQSPGGSNEGFYRKNHRLP